jgi:hypothetical protein
MRRRAFARKSPAPARRRRWSATRYTGYDTGLERLVGHLGVLGDRGLPSAVGEQPAAPGLRFIGYVPRPGMLGNTGKEALRAAKAIVRELRQAPSADPVTA